MGAVGIIRSGWMGTSGGPGLTQTAIAETTAGGSGSFFTTTNVQTAVNAMRTFWDSIKTLLPDEVVITVSPTVDIYDEINGELIASITAPTPPLSVQGTSTLTFSMAAGLKVNLLTGQIRNGRRVRGSIFLVPMTNAAFSSTGLALQSARTTINTAGGVFLSALATPLIRNVVYSRPVKDEEGNIEVVGATTTVTTWETNEKTAILRGRRD